MAALIPLILLVALYLLLVRPQKQRAQRQRQQMNAAVDVGARIQTAGGIVGRVVGVKDEFVQVEVSPDVIITFVRQAIAMRLPEPDLLDDGDLSWEERFAEPGPGEEVDPGSSLAADAGEHDEAGSPPGHDEDLPEGRAIMEGDPPGLSGHPPDEVAGDTSPPKGPKQDPDVGKES
jgi:preprotein translocase subunit YajC